MRRKDSRGWWKPLPRIEAGLFKMCEMWNLEKTRFLQLPTMDRRLCCG